MARYRKKGEEIDAWNKLDDFYGIKGICDVSIQASGLTGVSDSVTLTFVDRWIMVALGDYVVRKFDGMIRSMDRKTFEDAYELAEPSTSDPDMRVRLSMINLLKTLKEAKPNDRSALDRRVAVAITKAEELIAHYCFWSIADPEAVILGVDSVGAS